MSLKRWRVKNKRWLLSVLLINNRPFEPPEKAVLPLCSEGGAAATGSWERSGTGRRTGPRMRTEPGTDGVSGGRRSPSAR